MKSDYLLNWKAFLITLVMGVIVVPSVYFIHRSQLSKLQSFLLKDIEASKVSGDSEKAIKNLNRYLMYRPDSPRQKVDLTRLLMNREKDQLPLKLLIPMIVQAIGICESNQDLVEESKVFREKLIDSLMQDPSRWTDALEQMTKFAKDDPSPDLNRKMALVRSRKLLFLNADAKDGLVVPKTAPWVEEKLSMDPLDHLLDALSENLGDIELTDMIGKLIFPKSTYMAKSKLAQLGPKELNAVFKNMLEDMKEEHPDSAIAWGVDYRYMSLIDPEQARKDIEWALEKYSDNIEISREGVRYLVYRAATLARDGDSVNAENFLDRAMILLNNRKENEKTKDSFTYSQLAKIYLQKNQVDAAIETIEDGMRICPAPVIDLKLLLARIQLASGDSGKAWEAIKSAEETLRREAPILQTSVQKDFAIEVKELKVAYYSSKDDLPALNQELESYVVGATATTAEAEYRILDLAIQNYRKIGFWEKAADAYQRAIAIDPRNPAMRRGAAEAFAKINRLDEAIKQIEAISIKQPGDWMQLGTILLLKYANNEELAEESDWSRIQFAIDKARETSVALENGESFRNMLDVLQADLDIRRLAPSKRAEKVAVLKPRFLELCKSYPDDELLLRNVFSLFSVWGELKDAELVREIMSKANPNGVDSVIGEATRLAGANGAQSALDYLWSVLGKYPGDSRLNQFIVGLLRIDEGFGAAVDKLVAGCANNFVGISDLCEYLLRMPQYMGGPVNEQSRQTMAGQAETWSSNVAKAENSLRKLEGEKGTFWRYVRARRLLIHSAFDERQDAQEVDKLIEEIRNLRTDWANLHVLEGIQSEQRQDTSKAIKSYQSAIRMSVDDVRVYERLIELLYSEGRFEDAESYIGQLGRIANSSNRISSVSLRLSERNRSNSLELARLGVEARPLDPYAWIWYARRLTISSREMTEENGKAVLETAEKALLRARELAPEEVDSVRTLFQLYAQTGKTEKVESLIAEATSKDSKIKPESDRLLTVGLMYRFLGQFDKAQQYFSQAMSSGADSSRTNLLQANLLFDQGKSQEGLELLQKEYANKPANREVRHNLSARLIDRGTPEDWQTAERILTSPPYGNSVEDKLLFAKLLATKRTYVDLERSRLVLQNIASTKGDLGYEIQFNLGLVNRFLLDLTKRDEIKDTEVRSYEESVESALKQVALRNPPDEVYISAYATYLLEQNRTDEAEKFVVKLETIAPNTRGATLLRVLLCQAKQEQEEGKQALNEWATSALKKEFNENSDLNELPDDVVAYLHILFNALGDTKKGDAAFQLIFERSLPKTKALLWFLLRSEVTILRNGAMRLVIKHFDELDLNPFEFLRVLGLGANLAYDPKLTEDLIALVKSKLANAEKMDPLVITGIGDYLLAKKKSEDALDCYKQIIKNDPDNPIALNNLANVIVENKPDEAYEALGYIDRAIELGSKKDGKKSGILLDTKGAVLVALNRFDEAAEALRDATEVGGDPRSILHWYDALVKGKKLSEAEEVRQRIDFKALRDFYLSPQDRKILEKARPRDTK